MVRCGWQLVGAEISVGYLRWDFFPKPGSAPDFLTVPRLNGTAPSASSGGVDRGIHAGGDGAARLVVCAEAQGTWRLWLLGCSWPPNVPQRRGQRRSSTAI
ncbi:hypothetical protein FPJ55_09825 [Mycobacterium tuberculosis]|nr:hypothetical protein FPJ55_09825 [Mycobacterium tuberculosis]